MVSYRTNRDCVPSVVQLSLIKNDSYNCCSIFITTGEAWFPADVKESTLQQFFNTHFDMQSTVSNNIDHAQTVIQVP